MPFLLPREEGMTGVSATSSPRNVLKAGPLRHYLVMKQELFDTTFQWSNFFSACYKVLTALSLQVRWSWMIWGCLEVLDFIVPVEQFKLMARL